MGLKDWYPFLRKKGYNPAVLNVSAATTASGTSTRRIDLLSRFSVIRNAYTNNSIEQAHLILEKDIARFGTKEYSVIYVDGVQAVEKEQTALALEACLTNADVAIARDCRPGDIVISADSDMLAYSTISILWRPVSRGLILVYNISDLCQVLGLSRIQLTALAVVSNNDYGKNIHSLGPATNYSLIKSVEKTAVRETVESYLRTGLCQATQTTKLLNIPSKSLLITNKPLSAILCLYQMHKNSRAQQPSSTDKDQIIRLRSSQSVMRYKTVESPVLSNSPAITTDANIAESQQVFSQNPERSNSTPTPGEDEEANVGRITGENSSLQFQIVRCVRDAVREAASIKRRGQLTKQDVKDRQAGKDVGEDEGEIDLTHPGSTSTAKKNDHLSSVWSFLIHLYSGNYPQAHGIGQAVDNFIKRLGELGIYTPPRSRSELNERTPFCPSDLLVSVANQPRVELTKMYKHSSLDLQQQLAEMKKKGRLDPTVDIEIHEGRSAVENYLALNRLSRNPRRIIPLTSSEQPFVTFTERELVGFFFACEGVLRARVQELVQGPCTSLLEAQEWISGKESGFLLKNFLVDIAPNNLTVHQRGKVGHRAAIELPTLDELGTHLRGLDDKNFQPKSTLARDISL
ncbi:hypothetical protein BGZ72_001470 [Mortierella alpina]|nr:hypothetical protein BGZ72_001470 [Mortierella alpina]